MSVTEGDRDRARDLLFPELADEMPHNLDRLQFSDEAAGQMERIARALGDERKLALLDFADLIDRGPTFPLPPSIFSAMARERAEDGQ